MNSRLTDLDALCLEVRDSLSRSYIDEAIKAYRAGSFKAAIVSVYVAVTFDIIAKIRELADGGDTQAVAFVATHTKNVESGDAKRLLEIESNLLTDAENKFEFIDPISRRHFERLKQDRNLCAHPAFTIDGPLFEPEPELVRLYIVEAVRNLLSHPPTMGKTVLALFDRDVKGPSFPNTEDQVTRFVVNRYLSNARSSARSSLGSVVAKALLRSTPAGWVPRMHLLPAALEAVRAVDPALWANVLMPQIATLIDAAGDDYLSNAVALLVRFTDLRRRVPETTTARLRGMIDNIRQDSTNIALFEAVHLPEYADQIIAKFPIMDRQLQSAILSNFLHRAFWPAALKIFSQASSFRGAEALMDSLIMPFAPIASAKEVADLMKVVPENDQILHASGIPSSLEEFLTAVRDQHLLTPTDAEALIEYIDASYHPDRLKSHFKGALEALGISVEGTNDEA